MAGDCRTTGGLASFSGSRPVRLVLKFPPFPCAGPAKNTPRRPRVMKITVSELIVRYLERLGVEVLFGMPGAHVLPIYDRLHGSGVKSVLVKHEQGAAFMAGGYARASHRVAACIATAGPGATNLVTGIALLLGFRLPDNFNAPYAANNLKEFWGRWHISLSTFIRDYVYIPLGGNRQGVWRGNLNMLLAMLISGLWHGASINFIIWGALHGLGLALYKASTYCLPQPMRWPGAGIAARLLTFHYVAFAWIFFRCASLDDAKDMLAGIAGLRLEALFSPTGALLLACVVYIAVYRQLIALLRQLFAATTRLPWQLYPVPLGVFISLVIFASQSGVPGFIYASF